MNIHAFMFFFIVSILLNYGEGILTQLYFKNGDVGVINCEKGKKWFKDGNLISLDTNLDVSDTKLVIKSFSDKYIGLYTCETKKGNIKTFELLSAANVTTIESRSKNTVEGYDIELKCDANGVDKVIWLKDNKSLDGNTRITYGKFKSIENGMLKIEELVLEDAGNYSCTAGSETKSIIVKVIDKLVALYPFIAIVCEVAVVCVIFARCERRIAKKKQVR